jgi:hypothetical protein
MGLSLIEFETRIAEMLDERVTKNYKDDYETELSKTAGLIQSEGATFSFLVRVSSKTNNVEVLDRTRLSRAMTVGGVVATYGGVPLLDVPAGVLTSSLESADKSHDEVLAGIRGQSLSFANQTMYGNVGDIVSGKKVVSAAGAALKVKNRIWEDHEPLFEDLPELALSNTDIKLMARYCTSKSNMPAFAKMYNELAAVEKTSEKGSTLYVQKIGVTKRVLRYNSAFIAKAILQDMLAKKVGLPGMEKYGGAMASLGYMIGHEMLHVIYNHFDADVNQGLKDMQLPPLLNKSGSKQLKRIMKNTVPIEELMNNRFMSAMFDMPAVNGGYTVPEFRSKDNRTRGNSFESMTSGRWYFANAAVFPNSDDPIHAQALLNGGTSSDNAERAMDDLTKGAGKLTYDTWYPASYHVEAPNHQEDYDMRKKMPKEHTFFADSTLPIPSFWELDLLIRRSMAATNTDEELLNIAPSYSDQRKPEVIAQQNSPETPEDDTTLGDLAGQDVDDADVDADQDAEQQAPAKTVAKVQEGDIALDKALGIYKVVIGVVEDGEPQQLLTYPVTKLPTDLANKIMKAVQGHKDLDVLDAANISAAMASAKAGGAPHAAVRLGADAMASVVAVMSGDSTTDFDTISGDKLRPVYMDVRDTVDVDPNQQDGGEEDQEPQPDVEINNNPDMPPEDQEPEMGGGGGGDDDDEEEDSDAGGEGDADGEEDQDSDSDSGDGSQSGDDSDPADQDGEPTDNDATSDAGDPSDSDPDADADSDSDADSDGGDSAGDSDPDAEADPDADSAGGDSDSVDDSDSDSDSDDAGGGSSSDADSDAESDSDELDGASNDQSSDNSDSDSKPDDTSSAGDQDSGDTDVSDDQADQADADQANKRGDELAKQDDVSSSAEQQQQEWDDYLDSLGNEMDSTTLGSNDDSTDAVDRPDDKAGDDADGKSDDKAGDDADGKSDDKSGDDADDAGDKSGDNTDGFDAEDLFDRTKDDAEQRAERKRKQQLLKDQLDAINKAQEEADETMDKNREERKDNNGSLSSDTQKDQADAQSGGGSGSGGGGFGYGGKAKADKQVKGLLALIAEWARTLRGRGSVMDVDYNANKLSRRIKGAWGADDDVPVPRGRKDKALIVIFDTSGSLSGSAKLISKTISATLEALHKKMGVNYVIPISFDGKARKTGIYTVDEVEKVMPRFMRGSGSNIEPAFDQIVQVLKGTARLDDTSYKGDGKNINIGGILCMTDFDLAEYWYASGLEQGDIPTEMTKYLKPSGGNKTPWLNLCWLVDDGNYPRGSGLKSISYLKHFHSRNNKLKNKFKFSAIAANQEGVGTKVKLSSSGELTKQEQHDAKPLRN